MKAIRMVVAVLAGIGLNLGAAGVWAESWTLVPPTGNLGNLHVYTGQQRDDDHRYGMAGRHDNPDGALRKEQRRQ